MAMLMQKLAGYVGQKSKTHSLLSFVLSGVLGNIVLGREMRMDFLCNGR